MLQKFYVPVLLSPQNVLEQKYPEQSNIQYPYFDTRNKAEEWLAMPNTQYTLLGDKGVGKNESQKIKMTAVGLIYTVNVSDEYTKYIDGTIIDKKTSLCRKLYKEEIEAVLFHVPGDILHHPIREAHLTSNMSPDINYSWLYNTVSERMNALQKLYDAIDRTNVTERTKVDLDDKRTINSIIEAFAPYGPCQNGSTTDTVSQLLYMVERTIVNQCDIRTISALSEFHAIFTRQLGLYDTLYSIKERLSDIQQTLSTTEKLQCVLYDTIDMFADCMDNLLERAILYDIKSQISEHMENIVYLP